jgi:hypothetical protein
VLAIDHLASCHRNSAPHAFRQDLLRGPGGGGHAESRGLEPGAREDIVQKSWTGQMWRADDNLERSPPNKLFRGQCNCAGSGPEHHVSAATKQLPQVFTDDYRGAATVCHDGKTVIRAGSANPGTDLCSLVDQRDQL